MPTFFLSQSSSNFRRPISSYSASLSASPFRPLRVRPSTNSSGSCSSADFLHFAIWMGCTLNCDPNWLSVFSPRIALIATRALNFGLYCFLVVVIDLSFVASYPKSVMVLEALWMLELPSQRSFRESAQHHLSAPGFLANVEGAGFLD